MSETENKSAQGQAVSTVVQIKYGNNKSLVVNPNAGLAGVLDSVRDSLRPSGYTEKDHIELCDEGGKLINPRDFPPVMPLNAFLKPGAEDAVFIPFKVDRDVNRQILKVEALLHDAEKTEPEIMQKFKKENHVPRERRTPRGETSQAVRHVVHAPNHDEASASNSSVAHSAHSKREIKKSTNFSKGAKS